MVTQNMVTEINLNQRGKINRHTKAFDLKVNSRICRVLIFTAVGLSSCQSATLFGQTDDKRVSQSSSSISDSLAQETDYDPLFISKSEVKSELFVVEDKQRKRKIPVKVYLPPEKKPSPVVFFSHGLGGNRETCPYLGKHWAGRGYVCVFIQHPGSDDSIWKNAPLRERMQNMRQAANGENLQLRFEDVVAVIDQLEKWNKESSHELEGYCEMEKIGMSGHSFGAITTQGVSGQSFLGETRSTDSRIKAAVIFSPSAPRVGRPEAAFGKVQLPWLLMTGTNDISPIGNIDVQNRLSVYPALPDTGNKYELVLHEAEHSAFADRALPGERSNRNPNHHRAILAITTTFWDAYLKADPEAKTFLQSSEKIRNYLETDDRWQHK
jgi:dienelactone hydrolase